MIPGGGAGPGVACEVRVLAGVEEVSAAAAADAAEAIRRAVDDHGEARVVFAAGDSQVRFLERLTSDTSVPWGSLTGFHMDEYLDLPAGHPERLAAFLHRHLADRVPLRAFHDLDGSTGPEPGARRYASLLRDRPIDLVVLGVGENGHLAFDDPGVADFDDPLDVKVVELDRECRLQQVHEGHFATLDDVPHRAVTLTVPALIRARRLLVIAPELRKARPVARALRGPVGPACPASILQLQEHATVYLDDASASLLADPPPARPPAPGAATGD